MPVVLAPSRRSAGRSPLSLPGRPVAVVPRRPPSVSATNGVMSATASLPELLAEQLVEPGDRDPVAAEGRRVPLDLVQR